MTTRGIRRKKSSLGEVKVAVLGAPSVGKSDTKYRQEFLLDGEAIFVTILDTCSKSLDELPSTDTLQWADALFLVYSITDRDSFNYVRRLKQSIPPEIPITLVGNKADMVHLRQVSGEESEILAKDFECSFSEVSAAEQVHQVGGVFQELFREVAAFRRRAKQSLLDRVLGSRHAHRVYSRGKSDSALPKE